MLPRPSYLADLPDQSPMEATRETVKLMRQLIRAGKINDLVRRTAVALTADLPPKDWYGEVRALFDFVQNEIRFQWDVRGLETIHDADQVLLQRSGDCDDKAILLGALLESIGHPTQIFAMGFSPGQLTHVILITSSMCGRQWYTLDPTVDEPAGWCPPGIRQRMFIDNGDGNDAHL